MHRAVRAVKRRWPALAAGVAVVGVLGAVALRPDGEVAGRATGPTESDAAPSASSPGPSMPSTTEPDSGDEAESPGGGVPVPAATGLGRLEPALDPGRALVALGGIPVAAEVLVGYDRDAFGTAWSDVDGNGCNQRDDVLLRDALATTVRTAPQGACDHDVLAGAWLDPYTGRVLTFDDLKDEAQAQAIPIDHLVPLSEAHRSGAGAWSPERRLAFANDLGNLVAVGGAANSAKGDGDPPRWLPPDEVRCAYATAWVDVKARWALSVDSAERSALNDLLADC